MIINGREIRFRMSVLAATEIADLCPNGDIEMIGHIFEGEFSKIAKNAAKFIIALNRAYLINENGNDEGALTLNEILSLELNDFQALQDEAVASFEKNLNGEVEATAKKKDVTEGGEE